MKILMRNIGMTLHVIHTLQRAGHRQRPGQHGLAAPDHERREPRRVRGAARRRRAARATSTRTPAGARSTTTTWSARPRSWRRSSSRSSCAAPDYGDNGERLGFDLYPYTEDAVGAVKRSVLQWRFIDGVAAKIDGAALREAQQSKDAVARLRARLRRARCVSRTRRARRRHDRRQGASRSRRTARRSRRATEEYPLSTPQPGWAEQDPEDWWRAAQVVPRAAARRATRAFRADARARRARRGRRVSCGRRSSGTTSARRPSAPRSRSASASSG